MVLLPDGNLPAEVVYDLAQILQLDADHAFIIGGQALNLWAERYSDVPELSDYGPYTSKDLDYFGYFKAAEKLADALNGSVRVPSMDMPHRKQRSSKRKLTAVRFRSTF